MCVGGERGSGVSQGWWVGLRGHDSGQGVKWDGGGGNCWIYSVFGMNGGV